MTESEYAKLIKYMDRKFASVDGRFEEVDKRFDAMDKKFEFRLNDQFTKLFKYMSQEFKSVRGEIAEVKDSVNTYSNDVVGFAKQTETYYQEMLALGHKVDRHEKWHHQTAKAIGIKLSA